MKSVFTITLVAIVASGCSTFDIQRRVYRSGFYINSSPRTLRTDQNLVLTDTDTAIALKESTSASESIDATVTIDTVENSVDLPKQFVTSSESIRKSVAKPSEQFTSYIQEPKQSAIQSQKLPADSDGSLAITLGWIFISLAIISLFILWPLIFCLVPGIVLLVVGYSNKKSKKHKEETTTAEPVMVDVVYLKNGSIIRGTIIEQVPGVSLKIKTSDGSVFFYKMEEVLKITKEEKEE